jgi:non-specific serine/threonine protein kinase
VGRPKKKVHLAVDTTTGLSHVNGFSEVFNRNSDFFLQTPSGRVFKIPDTPLYKWWTFASSLGNLRYRDPQSEEFIRREGFENFSLPPGIRFQPKGLYQILAVKRILLSNTCLWLDMGLGKTYITLLAALHLFSQKQNRFLITCPVSVFFAWEEEIRKHVLPAIRPEVVILHGTKRKEKIQRLSLYRDPPEKGPLFFLTSYEGLATSIDGLKGAGFSMMIFDECSKIKNMETARTKAAHRLADGFPGRIVCLSGTPSTKSPEGYFSFYELMYKGGSGHNSLMHFQTEFLRSTRIFKARFGDGTIKFCKEENYPHLIRRHGKGRVIQQFTKHAFNETKLEDLKRISRRHSFVLKKDDVAKDIPPKIFLKRSCEMHSDQANAYAEILAAGKGQRERVQFNAEFLTNSITGKLHQVANGFLIMPDKTIKIFDRQPKFEETQHLLDEIGDEKTILWSPFRFQIAKLMEFLEAREIPAFQIHGGVSSDDRTTALENFRDAQGQAVLVANPEVAGFGLNLEFSKYQIFITNWYKPDVRKQAVDRQHRITQTSPVTIVDLVTRDTVEGRILDSLREEIKLEDLIFSF